MEVNDAGIIILCFTLVQVLSAWWIKAKLTASIQHKYDKRLEEFKVNQLRKDKASVVAEFLAEWTHLKGSDTKRLNQLLWELSLYLPSELVRDINSMISSSLNGKTAPEILISVREHLLDGQDKLSVQDISHFKHPENNSIRSSSV